MCEREKEGHSCCSLSSGHFSSHIEVDLPEKVPEKTPGEWLTKLSMTAPGCLHSSAVDVA